MKRTVLLVVFLLWLIPYIFAENGKKMAVGLGSEWNMNSRDYFAGGISVGFDCNISPPCSVGVTVVTSNNFTGIAVMENAAMFRWYFSGSDYSGFFIQTDLGVFLVFEDGKTTPLFLGGLKSGYRLPVGKTFYVEPHGRIGYPFAFGMGVTTGMMF